MARWPWWLGGRDREAEDAEREDARRAEAVLRATGRVLEETRRQVEAVQKRERGWSGGQPG